MKQCEESPNVTCCSGTTVNNVTGDCPLQPCQHTIESHLHQAVNIAGCLGLIFSFTEVCQLHFVITVHVLDF